jgi:hypothetical protein
MRVYFSHILESYDDRFPKGETLGYKQHTTVYSEKGVVRNMELTNVKSFTTKTVAKVIGLGYHDFKEGEYPEDINAVCAVIDRKLKEVGIA